MGVTDTNAANICFYCSIGIKKKVPAVETIHDKRGCVRVCAEHAKWRATTSKMFGHSKNCPDPQA
jgi:hypothetical protein